MTMTAMYFDHYVFLFHFFTFDYVYLIALYIL